MENLDKKIIAYLGRTPDFQTEVKLLDDGSGPYIKEWNVGGLAKPSDSQMASYETAGNAKEADGDVRRARRGSYLSVKDQLDLLYKDMVAGKLDTTGEWAKKIKAVKDANPKE